MDQCDLGQDRRERLKQRAAVAARALSFGAFEQLIDGCRQVGHGIQEQLGQAHQRVDDAADEPT